MKSHSTESEGERDGSELFTRFEGIDTQYLVRSKYQPLIGEYSLTAAFAAETWRQKKTIQTTVRKVQNYRWGRGK